MANQMTGNVQWLEKDKINFKVTGGGGQEIIVDPEQKIGVKPMEMVLLGLGACASYDVVGILQKTRQDIHDVDCQLSATRADEIPAVFTDIHLHFVVKGKDIKEAQVKKAIELSSEKYCSASRMLAQGGVKITHDYEIVAV